MTTTTVSSGQTSSGIVLGSGDQEFVLSGGVAVGTTVNSGGVAHIQSGGIDSASVINNLEFVSAGGTAISATVNDNGLIEFLGAGSARHGEGNREPHASHQSVPTHRAPTQRNRMQPFNQPKVEYLGKRSRPVWISERWGNAG